MMNMHHTDSPIKLAFFLALLSSTCAFAQDHADIDRTQITGNRELPKVTYIVPWKKPAADKVGKPVTSVLDEALSPIDRDVFRRQVRYGAQVQAQANTSAGNMDRISMKDAAPSPGPVNPIIAPAPATK